MQSLADSLRAHLKSQSSRIGDWFGKPDATGFCFAVQVENGLHSGHSFTIPAPEITIGGANENDIMLLDDCFSGPQISLSSRSTPLGSIVYLATERPDVMVHGHPFRSQSEPETLPVIIEIDSVRLKIQNLGTRQSLATHPVLLLAAIVATLAVTIGALSFSDPFKSVALDQVPSTQEQPRPETGSLSDELLKRLRSSELQGVISTQTLDTNTIAVNGVLPAEMRNSWLEIRRKFEADFPYVILLTRFEMTPELADLPLVSAVLLGDVPKIVFANGTEAGLGDEINNGWIIDAIGAEGFTLNWHGHQQNVMYQ